MLSGRRAPDSYPAGRAAVLVCLFGSRSGTNLNVLLSTRSEALRTYPGHAFEEVGIPIDTTRIRYLTALPPFLVRSLTLVTPVVCFILDYSLKPDINPSEVSNLFSFPLEGFLVSSSTSPVFHKPTPTPTGPTDSIPSPPFHTFEDYPWFDGRPHRFHSFEARPKPITGLTAEILIHVASIAYGRPPEYELMAPGEMSQHELIDRATQSPTWSELRREKVREGRGEACAKGKL
ncbi:SPOSA6832_03104, partial [Sporobolomyces salmonicolor]